MQQHIAAGRDVLGRGAFDLVVADAVLARDEDHAGRGQPGHVHRIVPGTRTGTGTGTGTGIFE